MNCTLATVGRLLLVLVASVAVLCAATNVPGQPSNAFRDRAPELQRLVRQIADQLKRLGREDPTAYDQQYDHLSQAIAAWNESSRSDSDAEIMTGWLRAALRSVNAGADRPLPPLPQFNTSRPPAESVSAAAEPLAPPGLEQIPATPAIVPQPAVVPSIPPSVAAPHRAEPIATREPPAAAPRSAPQKRRRSDGLAPIYRSPRAPGEPRPHVSHRVPGEDTSVDQASATVEPHPPVAAPPFVEPIVPEPATFEEPAVAERPTPSPRAVPSEPIEKLFDDNWLKSEPVESAEQDAPSSDDPTTDEATTDEATTAEATTAEATLAPEAAADLSPPPPPTTAQSTLHPATNPFADDPLPEDAPHDERIADRGLAAGRHQPADERDAPAVNLGELRARIEGYDRGLRKIEARLMGYEALSTTELNRLADSLDELLNQRELVALYLGTLDDGELKGLPQLHSAGPAIQLLSQQIVEQRHAVRRRADPDDARRRQELELLQEASRRLSRSQTAAQ